MAILMDKNPTPHRRKVRRRDGIHVTPGIGGSADFSGDHCILVLYINKP